jgi:hypothetical protein
MECVEAMSIETQLLTLASVACLQENKNYYPYFEPRPQVSGQKIDPRDIGAINIEANTTGEYQPYRYAPAYGQYIDTREKKFDTGALYMLLDMAVQPGLTFSLDVSEFGADTWLNSVFIQAANGDQAANDAIVEALHNLTGGHSAKYWDSGSLAVMKSLERIHLGHFIGEAGHPVDIRLVDHLAVMNMIGRSDPTIGAKWANSFFDPNADEAICLAVRRQIISELLRTKVTYTGMARRCTITAQLMYAATRGCADAGLDMTAVNPARGAGQFAPRSTGGFSGLAHTTGLASGLFNSGHQPRAQTNYRQSGLTRRYGQ